MFQPTPPSEKSGDWGGIGQITKAAFQPTPPSEKSGDLVVGNTSTGRRKFQPTPPSEKSGDSQP